VFRALGCIFLITVGVRNARKSIKALKTRIIAYFPMKLWAT